MDGLKASRCEAILIHNSVACTQVNLGTPLQAVAIRFFCLQEGFINNSGLECLFESIDSIPVFCIGRYKWPQFRMRLRSNQLTGEVNSQFVSYF